MNNELKIFIHGIVTSSVIMMAATPEWLINHPFKFLFIALGILILTQIRIKWFNQGD